MKISARTNQKLKQLELFAWGAFTTITVMRLEKFIDYDPGIWAKVGIWAVIFAGWAVYILKLSQENEDDRIGKPTGAQRRSILIIVIIGMVISFLAVIYFFGKN